MRMACFGVLGLVAISLTGASHAQSLTESREQYLSRLKDICSVECLKPRDFRRKARKKGRGYEGDLAVIMDVRDVRRAGENFQLLSQDLERSNFVIREILGGAGINTSNRNGIGGLPGKQNGNTTPDLIIIELDEQAFSDFLNTPDPVRRPASAGDPSDGIVVEGDLVEKKVKPSLTALRTRFRNRRIVVRGKPVLTPTWVGGRRDFRRKQVTLEIDNADDLALLPRYDEDGNPIAE